MGDTQGFAQWTPQQPTLDLPLSESLPPLLLSGNRRCVLGDRDDQTGLPSLPKNPAQGCNYPHLKKERSLTLQAWPHHPQVPDSESLGECSRAERGSTGPVRNGEEQELLQPRNWNFFGNREDKDL